MERFSFSFSFDSRRRIGAVLDFLCTLDSSVHLPARFRNGSEAPKLCTQLFIGRIVHRRINDDRYLLFEALSNGFTEFIR